jgi:hypothetical protein
VDAVSRDLYILVAGILYSDNGLPKITFWHSHTRGWPGGSRGISRALPSAGIIIHVFIYK